MAARIFRRSVSIPTGTGPLVGELAVPAGALGVVVLASAGQLPEAAGARLSSRLTRAALAVLSASLRSETELITGAEVSPTALAARLLAVHGWLQRDDMLACFVVGYFGVGRGADAALLAAARGPRRLAGVVAASGRYASLTSTLKVSVPTMLVAADKGDAEALRRARRLVSQLAGPKQFHLIPGAGPSYVAPAATAYLGELAANWLSACFRARVRPPATGWTDAVRGI